MNAIDTRLIHIEATFGKKFWKRLIDIFEDEVDVSVLSFEYLNAHAYYDGGLHHS
jgi:hypothetical protein